MTTLTRTEESSAPGAPLRLAFELGARVWKLGFTVGVGQRPYVRQIPAGAVSVLAAEIARAKTRFGLSAERAVVSCYEAGRDGFWLHRYLTVRSSLAVAWPGVGRATAAISLCPENTNTLELDNPCTHRRASGPL